MRWTCVWTAPLGWVDTEANAIEGCSITHGPREEGTHQAIQGHRGPPGAQVAEGAGRAGRGFIGVSTGRGGKQMQGWTVWIVRALGCRCSLRSGPCPGD